MTNKTTIKIYCECCKKEVNAKITKGKETFKVFGENVEINSKYLKCPKCGEKIYYEEFDNNNILNTYKEYRKKHKLLTPEEIKDIRKSYGLSQNEFSNLLGWGEKTICRYEGGAVQDNSHNDLLKLLKDKNNMKKFLIDHEDNVSEKTKNKILASLDDSQSKESINFIKILFNYEATDLSGYKKFDYDKFCSMVRYFTERIDDLSITKLLKLLNYADCLYFEENCISISGIRYKHMQYGPVPDNYDILFYTLKNEGIITDDFITKHYETHVICKGTKKIKNNLSKDEIDVLNRVYERFKDFTAKKISDTSHQEKGYIETKDNEYISYEYAQFLSM